MRVVENKHVIVTFISTDVQRIVIFGLQGNDKIVVSGALFQPATIFGDDGNDTIVGGSGHDQISGGNGRDTIAGGLGNNILCGDNGNDKIVARPGRNILIGGTGRDRLYGNAFDDILVAGSTAHDEDDAALQSILNEWTSGNSYAMRVNNIRNGGGQNGAFVFDDTTVFDDGAVDNLIGDGGLDWFLVGLGDKIKDRAPSELVN
jgi:Ca2+-binding RTX toxin-like protein